MTSYRIRAYLLLILVAAIWGSAAPVIKYTLNGIDPIPFLAYRFFISAIVAFLFFAVKIKKGKKFRQFKENFPLAVVYSLIAMPLALGILFTGLDKTTVLDLTLVGVIGPLIVTAGGAYFFRDRITKREKIGIAIVLIGVTLNSFYPILKHEGIRLTGNMLLLAFLFVDSSSVLLVKHLVKKKVKPINLANLAFISGAVVFLPIVIFIHGAGGFLNMLLELPFKYHAGVWFMALLSGNLAYTLYIRAVRSIEISEAVLFGYLQPVVTVPLAILWLHESISASFLIGALIIVVGLIIAETKSKNFR